MVTLAKEKKTRRNTRVPLLPRKDERDGEEQDPIPNGFSGASFSGAVFNLSTTIIGAGIMALPATMKVLGLLPGLTMIVLVAILTESSIEMLMKFSRTAKSASYSSLMRDSFGGSGRVFLQICVVVNNLGVLVVYMIIIGDVLSGTSSSVGVHHRGVIEGWLGLHWWTGRAYRLFLTTVLVFAPLISFKRVDSLRYTSALSVGLAVVFVLITAGITVVKSINGSVGMPRLLPEIVDMASFWKLFTTVPVLVTAYICHYSIHPIQNELKDSSQMRSIVRTSLTLCSSIYVATSFFGFLLFREQTLEDVLANFDTDLHIHYGPLLSDIVRVTYVVHLMLVFPIIFFSLRLNLDGLLFPSACPIVVDDRRFFFVTGTLMSLIFLGANYIPSIWDAFQITGATAAVSIGFIFPAAITLRDIHGIATENDKALSRFTIILAISTSVVAISSDVYAIFSERGVMSRA